MSPTYAPDCPCIGLALNAMLFMQIDLVVATPKRLSHLVKAKQVDLSAVQYLILDEADKLFELGFQSHIDSIIGACSNSNIVSHSAQCSWAGSLTPRNCIGFVTDACNKTGISYDLLCDVRYEQRTHVPKLIAYMSLKCSAISVFLPISCMNLSWRWCVSLHPLHN